MLIWNECEKGHFAKVLVERSGYSNLYIWILNQPVCLGVSFSEWKETFSSKGMFRISKLNVSVECLLFLAL